MAGAKRAPDMPVNRARSAVRKIVSHHFGSPPRLIARETGGQSNLVFNVEHQGEEFIVRLNPKPAKLNPFLKEQWATERARSAGVPLAEILAVGNDPAPYMVLRKMPGQPATQHPERMRIVRELGRFAALINSVPARGYGATFDWSSRISARQTAPVARPLPDTAPPQGRSHSNHSSGGGQQREKPGFEPWRPSSEECSRRRKGQITAILDWETCTSNLTPEWELSAALHDLSIDEKEAFLDGYGLSGKEVSAAAPAVKAFNIVNYFRHG
jgi:hypothetical protein